MPYTKQELENIGFYQEFVDKLRYTYLDRMSKSAANFFRDDTGALISFEDIFTGLGIEDVNVNTGLYKFLYEVDYSMYTTHQMLAAKNDPDIVLNPEIRDKRKKQFTVANKEYPEYIKTKNLEKIIDRNISELSQSMFAESLPEGITNGDVITNEFADDFRKWLIQNNQKRIFPDLATFYGTVMEWGDIKTLTMEQLRTIPDGEPVE